MFAQVRRNGKDLRCTSNTCRLFPQSCKWTNLFAYSHCVPKLFNPSNLLQKRYQPGTCYSTAKQAFLELKDHNQAAYCTEWQDSIVFSLTSSYHLHDSRHPRVWVQRSMRQLLLSTTLISSGQWVWTTMFANLSQNHSTKLQAWALRKILYDSMPNCQLIRQLWLEHPQISSHGCCEDCVKPSNPQLDSGWTKKRKAKFKLNTLNMMH